MCGLGSCAGHILVVTERLVSICAVTSVVVCIMFTLAVTMGIGVGLGYNYCFVEFKANPGKAASLGSFARSGAERDENKGSLRRTPAAELVISTESPQPTVTKYTLTLPLHGNVDFPSLLSKLRARNKNATIELIT